MTFAWYGHLKFTDPGRLWAGGWWQAGASPFVEYCFAVPANRWGPTWFYSAAELKTMQEVVITPLGVRRVSRCSISASASP